LPANLPRDSLLAPASFPDLGAAYVALLRLATEEPQFRISPRGNAAREVIGVAFRLPDPRQRLPYVAARKANPVFHYAEALWYLAGRRDLAMIGHYAPSMAAGSRDGLTVDGSAYGARIFAPAPGDDVAPFDRVLELLRRECDSKRALIPVFSARELTGLESNPDVACLAGLHFLPRDGRLHMVCSMRANDLDCGLLSDVFSFTMIQEYAAVRLGLELGTYTHYMGSAHVNDHDADRVGRVLAEAAAGEAPAFPFPRMPATTTTATVSHVLEHEELLRTNRAAYSVEDISALGLAPYWEQALLLFEVHRQITHDKAERVDADVLAALEPGLRWLLARKWPAAAGASSR
jgi:thymidylate synthase